MVDPFQSDNRANRGIFILKVYFSTHTGDDKRYEIAKSTVHRSSKFSCKDFLSFRDSVFKTTSFKLGKLKIVTRI